MAAMASGHHNVYCPNCKVSSPRDLAELTEWLKLPGLRVAATPRECNFYIVKFTQAQGPNRESLSYSGPSQHDLRRNEAGMELQLRAIGCPALVINQCPR